MRLAIILAQVIALLIAAFAPVALVAGAIPGRGHALFFEWAKGLIGALIAKALAHEPELLFLDEPTAGVDPSSRREFWDILSDLHIEGVTILVSTPYMDEADRCSRVGLMYTGGMVICDTPKNIRGRIQAELVELYPQDWQSAHELIETLPGVLEVQTYGESLHILVDNGEQRLPQIEESLNKQNIVYQSARIAPTRMEEAFISLIRQMDEGSDLVEK